MNNRLISAQVNDKLWGKECVTLALAAKKSALSKIGIPFNYVVLDRGAEEKEDELIHFLTTLRSQVHLVNGMRFQLAIKSGVHWTACDIQIENQMPLLFILDAANVIEAYKNIDIAFNKFFSKTKTYVYFPDYIVSSQEAKSDTEAKIQMVEKPRQLQFDQVSCAFCTIDHLSTLATLDLFNILRSAGLKGTKSNPDTYFKINPDNCPEELACLFATTQSLDVLQSFPLGLKHRVITSRFDGFGLFSLNAIKGEDRVESGGKIKKSNKTIESIREKEKQDVKKVLTDYSDSEINGILSHRNGQTFLQSPQDVAVKLDRPDQAFDYLIQKMLAEIDNVYSNHKTDLNLYHPSLIGCDIRQFCTLRMEISSTSCIASIEDSERYFTKSTYAILKKAAEHFVTDKTIPIVSLVAEFRKSLKDRLANYEVTRLKDKNEQNNVAKDFIKEVKTYLASQKRWYHLFSSSRPTSGYVDIEFEIGLINEIISKDIKHLSAIGHLDSMINNLEYELNWKKISSERRTLIEAVLNISKNYPIKKMMNANRESDEITSQAYSHLDQHFKTKFSACTGKSEQRWGMSHQPAIHALMKLPGMSEENAMGEMQDLDFRQLDGITKGLSRRDVEGLFEHEITALCELRALGLTADHLTASRPYQHYFSYGHRDALIYLIRECKMPVEEAIKIVSSINDPTRAMGVSIGIPLQDLSKLNLEQISAYSKLKDNGLLIMHLFTWQESKVGDGFDNEFGWNFNSAHKRALIYLIQEQKISPKAAIAEINQINGQQAFALIELYSTGVRGADLRDWKGKNFSYIDRDALIKDYSNRSSLVYSQMHT
ncbi:MAG: hypothetical protein ABI370_00990 [Gammaproteobacteria bacterium]